MTDTNAVPFTSERISFVSGGMTARTACGTITWKKVCAFVSPEAYPASYCPLSTEIRPLLMISEILARLQNTRAAIATYIRLTSLIVFCE